MSQSSHYDQSDSEQQFSEIIRLKAAVEIMEAQLKEIQIMVKEMSGRRLPWGVIAPLAAGFLAFSINVIIQVNITVERTAQIQKAIADNAVTFKEQYVSHSTEIEKLRMRLEVLERHSGSSRAKE
jgi:hypothetical protein